MTVFYLASRYSRRAELRRYRRQLQHAGQHTVISRWLDESCQENAETALRDLLDVEAADGIILFCEAPRTQTRGARFVEFGFAAALNKILIAIGPTENIFLHLPDIERYDTWKDCFAALSRPSLRHVWGGPGVTAIRAVSAER